MALMPDNIPAQQTDYNSPMATWDFDSGPNYKIDFGSAANPDPNTSIPDQFSMLRNDTSYVPPEPVSFMDKYFGQEGSQQRVDNYWRAGSAGLAGLGIIGSIYDANKKRQASQDAVKWLESKQDPNRGFYQSRLAQLFQNQGNYSQDPQSAARSLALREAINRRNAAQGRSGYSAAQQQTLNDAAAYAQNNEIKNLLAALQGGDQLDAAKANIMANTPSYNPTTAIPYLQGLFTTGQDYTRAMGFSSEYPTLSQNQRDIIAGLPREQQIQFAALNSNQQARAASYLPNTPSAK